MSGFAGLRFVLYAREHRGAYALFATALGSLLEESVADRAPSG